MRAAGPKVYKKWQMLHPVVSGWNHHRAVITKLVKVVAFLNLLPLALTSTQGWMRRLGKNWKRLHRWVYLAAAAAAVHFIMLVKTWQAEPLIYAAIVAALLITRADRLLPRQTKTKDRLERTP